MSDNSKTLHVKSEIEKIYSNICRSFAELDLDSVLGYFSDRDDLVKISNGAIDNVPAVCQ